MNESQAETRCGNMKQMNEIYLLERKDVNNGICNFIIIFRGCDELS